jgi:hypothetical protein
VQPQENKAASRRSLGEIFAPGCIYCDPDSLNICGVQRSWSGYLMESRKEIAWQR